MATRKNNVVRLVHAAVYPRGGKINPLPDMAPEELDHVLDGWLQKCPDGFMVHFGRQFENERPEYRVEYKVDEDSIEEDITEGEYADMEHELETWRERQPLPKRRIYRGEQKAAGTNGAKVKVMNICNADVYLEDDVVRAFTPEGSRTGPVLVSKSPVVDLLVEQRKLVVTA